MAQCYSASYSNCRNAFIIDGLPDRTTDDDLLLSFICVLRNILSRSGTVIPSEFLSKELGDLPRALSAFTLLDKDGPLPYWELTIKGAESGYNPAREFFYTDDLWDEYLPSYSWVRQLIIPEAPLAEIIEKDAESWKGQAVDFYLPAAGLVIEIDGIQHQTDPEQKKLDAKRDHALKAVGVHTTRIPVESLRERNRDFQDKMKEILEILEGSKEIQQIRQQEDTEEMKLRCRYEAVIRYQYLLLELLQHDVITFRQKHWVFNIADNDLDAFSLAFQDLFLWFRNLYQLKGLSFAEPDVCLNEHPGTLQLRCLLKEQPDDRPVTCPTVFNSPWIGKDYYHVASAEPIDYEIPWPSEDSSDRGEALKFFLRQLFMRYDAETGEYIRYDHFNQGQWPILVNILCRNRTIGILPTGGGKSLCYQLAAMLQPGITVVVCPINSLQMDQQRNLEQTGITRAAYIASTQESNEKHEVIANLGLARYQFVWISPERFQSRAFRDSLRVINTHHTIAYAVIDEVHCLSEWGHDFRTSYLTLIDSITHICPGAAIVGLTATATQDVLNDLKAEFGVDGTAIRSLPTLERSNLTFRVINTNNKMSELIKILKQHHYGETGADPDSGLVFGLTRDNSDDPDADGYSVAALIREKFPVNSSQIGVYHSKIGNSKKVSVQNAFLDNQLRLLSTTKAFGMGVNKTDLYFTVHFHLPWSVEAFYQEAGRAGRDGITPCDCTILYSPKYFGKADAINRAFLDKTTPEEIKDLVTKHKLEGDLSTIFYLWGLNNKGVRTDLAMIGKLLNKIARTGQSVDDDGNPYFRIQAEKDTGSGKTPEDYSLSDARLELALYRLKILGVVKDWMVDWKQFPEPNSFDIYFTPKLAKELLVESLEKQLTQYFARHKEEHPDQFDRYDGVAQDEAKYRRDAILFYANILISWNYDHIVASRRRATKRILDLCRDYTDEESFRRQIDGFLKLSEQTVVLDGILDEQQNYRLWFQAFRAIEHDEDRRVSERFLDRAGIEQLRLTTAQYTVSYHNATGLNLVYVLSGAFSGHADMGVESEQLDECFAKINEKSPEDREAIWQGLEELLEHYSDEISEDTRDALGRSFVKGYPEKSRKIHELLGDRYSLAYLIMEATRKIQTAAAEIRR